MIKKIILLLLFFFYLNSNQSYSLENKIINKVNNEIVTLFDVKQEKKYLIILNPNLKKLDKITLNKLANESILKEQIKKIEIKNYFNIEKSLDDPNLTRIIRDLYNKIGIKNEINFVAIKNGEHDEKGWFFNNNSNLSVDQKVNIWNLSKLVLLENYD